MRLRSGLRLVSPPPAPQGGRHHRRRLRGLEDSVSILPEDLLLQVLALLKPTARAARAGAVCRNWRGLWSLDQASRVTFNFVKPRLLEAVLAKVTRPRLDLLDIILEVKRGAQVSWLLCAAARLVPEKLIVWVWDRLSLEDDPIELPCFDRTSSLSLQLMNFRLLPPPFGEFTALKSLSLDSCSIDIGALLALCPCLHMLNMCDLVGIDTMMVHSALLEELSLKTTNTDFATLTLRPQGLIRIHWRPFLPKISVCPSRQQW